MSYSRRLHLRDLQTKAASQPKWAHWITASSPKWQRSKLRGRFLSERCVFSFVSGFQTVTFPPSTDKNTETLSLYLDTFGWLGLCINPSLPKLYGSFSGGKRKPFLHQGHRSVRSSRFSGSLYKPEHQQNEKRLTIGFDQHLLLAHVLHVDGTVDDVLRRGAVIVLHLLALVALDLKGISCHTELKGWKIFTDGRFINRCSRHHLITKGIILPNAENTKLSRLCNSILVCLSTGYGTLLY